MERLTNISVLVFIALFMLLNLAPSARAHDANIVTSFNGVGTPYAYEVYHEDESPWKGWVYVTVTNTSDIDWGDFHFEIFSYDGNDISNVDIVTDPNFAPTTSQNNPTISTSNMPSTGSKLCYFYYDDPILKDGDFGTFTFYTDNTTDNVNFGIKMWPTPVPEPATSLLLGISGMMLFIRRKRK